MVRKYILRVSNEQGQPIAYYLVANDAELCAVAEKHPGCHLAFDN